MRGMATGKGSGLFVAQSPLAFQSNQHREGARNAFSSFLTQTEGEHHA